MPVGLPEFVENPENRCPVVLVLDTSGSMSGAPIEALTKGVRTFREALLKDEQASLRVEIAIVTFGPVKLAQDFVTIDHFTPPELKADGTTPMGEALTYALELVEQRKQTYRSNGLQYYRPWVFLITDGAPDSTSPWRQAASVIQNADATKKIIFFGVGVEGADMNVLRQITPTERPPMLLNGLDFGALFSWLSASMIRVSGSQVGAAQVELPPIGWGTVSV